MSEKSENKGIPERINLKDLQKPDQTKSESVRKEKRQKKGNYIIY